MKRIVLLRHGQSQWNLQNRFTGWTDVDLTPHGIEEARAAALRIQAQGIVFDRAYTSVLTRAIHTLNIVLATMRLDWIPVRKSWRLNEKHYGALQGLDKAETAERYGADRVHAWRRSYDVPPAPLSPDAPANPRFDPRYAAVPSAWLPLTESLRDTIARALPYWECEIFPALADCRNILVVAHGNSLRGIVKHLRDISDTDIAALEIPTATPWVFEFDDNLVPIRDYSL